MHRYALTLVFQVALLALPAASASPTVLPAIHQASVHVNYFDQDADSSVDTASDSDGTYDVFYDGLSQDGRWFYDDDYGYVWQPNVAASTPDWRPYEDGHWAWTDRGWYWDSNEDFAWAAYHYGRWALLENTGWIWIPGSNWAPAWVSWRHSDNNDYVGWAPLPPESRFNPNIGFHNWSDTYYDMGPAAYAFIRIADFARPSYREFCLPPQQNIQIIQQTTNITNITYQNNVINNFGPPHDRIAQLVQQQSGQTLPSYKLNYAAQTQPGAAFKTSVQGNQLNVVAPPHTLKAMATAAPQVSRQLGKAQVNRGWQNIPQAQAQQLQRQFAQQAPAPKDLPAKPTLPVKPQIQAAAQPGIRSPNAAAPSNVNPATRTEAKTPVQSEATKPTVQSSPATAVEHPNGTQTAVAKKPETAPGTTEKSTVAETKKAPSESGKQGTEAKAAHPGGKTADHLPPAKPEEQETKKAAPPPAAAESHSPESHEGAQREDQASAEHHVATSHDPKAAARPDQGKKRPEEKKKPEEDHQ
jgi:hypothetical protein